MHILRTVYRTGTTFAQKALSKVATLRIPRTRAFFHRYWGTPMKIALIALCAFLILAGVRSIVASATAPLTTSNARSVVVLPAGSSTRTQDTLEITGEVVSQSQGDLRTQSAGIITNVYSSVGASVRAGTILAAIENASERAGVAQAKAGVAQAQAAYNKVSGGTREQQLAVLRATTASAEQALAEAYTGARNTLLNTYAATNSAFSGGVDSLFANADSSNPTLAFTTTQGVAKTQSEHQRFLLENTIRQHSTDSARVGVMGNDEVVQRLNAVEADVRSMKAMLDSLIVALDGSVASASASASTLATYKATATAARSSLLGTLASLSAARNSLQATTNGLVVAQENEALGVAGAQSEDVAVAQAQLDSAHASLSQAYARLEDTYVRAPVSGVITRFTAKPGDFVQAYQDVGLVANTNALEVKAFVAPEFAARLSVGAVAVINDTYDGVVTSIARGIDPVQRQIEVHIAFADTHAVGAVPNGTRATVRFPVVADTPTTPETPSALFVPIAALKLIGSEAFVFTVNEDSTLEAHAVTLGSVVRNTVEIVSGIEAHTPIVVDARGLNAGDSVIVTTN